MDKWITYIVNNRIAIIVEKGIVQIVERRKTHLTDKRIIYIMNNRIVQIVEKGITHLMDRWKFTQKDIKTSFGLHFLLIY